MIYVLLWGQIRLGWQELHNAPEKRTLRGLLVVILIGYVPGLGTIGLLSVLLEIHNWFR
jgi:hypothetical protein